MSKKYVYDYPHPAVAADIVVFTLVNGSLRLLLIKRGEAPFKGSWALPGGFVREDETVEVAAKRELAEEAGVINCSPTQFGIYSEPERDPRQRVISVAFYDCVRADEVTLKPGTDAVDAEWIEIDCIKSDDLAFDHARIIADALVELRKSCRETPVAAKMLPRFFKLTDLQLTIETITGAPIDKRNFRRQTEEKGWLEKTDQEERGAHRPASLYTLTQDYTNDVR